MRDLKVEKERVEQLEKKLKSEILRYDAWIEDILSEKYVNCAYCGHRYGKENDSANMEAVRKHVENCSKHPMAKEKERADKAEALARELVELLKEADNLIGLASYLISDINLYTIGNVYSEDYEEFLTRCDTLDFRMKEVLGDGNNQRQGG